MTSAQRTQLIAVIEDDSSVRKALDSLLRAEGFAVYTFDTAEAFLARGLSVPWRCLIVDITLPGISGLDLQQQLIEAALLVPVIIVTGLADHDGALAARAARQGARAFLLKPVASTQLLRVIRQI